MHPAPPAHALLAPTDGWVLVDLELHGEHELRARFEADDAWLQLRLLPRDAPAPVLKRLRACSVKYRGHLPPGAPSRKASAGALIGRWVEAIDARLDASPHDTLRDALAGGRPTGRLRFSRRALEAMLGPWLGELVGGWRLRDIYPSSQLQAATRDKLELVLDFEDAGGQRARFLVGPADPSLPAYRQTTHFRLVGLETGRERPPALRTLSSLLSFVLQLADSEALDVEFPDTASDLALLAAPPAEADRDERVLNLAISAECGQACRFCSVKELRPPLPYSEPRQDQLLADLSRARAAGIGGVRFNGYDPLAWPGIVDLAEHATALGFSFAEVFSPCTRLADRAFTESLLAALPARRRFVVPIYGPDAATHDAVVGTPGAFGAVLAAVEHLLELDPDSVALSAVLTPENVDTIVLAAAAWAERGLHLGLHLPFPSSESVDDAWRRVVMAQGELARRVAAQVAALPDDAQRGHWRVRGVAPCFQFRAFRDAGLGPRTWLAAPLGTPRLPGTEYRDEAFAQPALDAMADATVASTVPCPHAEGCALRLACPQEFLRFYAEDQGLADVAPVGLEELLDLPPIPADPRSGGSP